ncbi:hypothetical protein BDV36DRAFT_298277 [Aspergillus pseudocaelatus]|uniref:Uncharacterized protein n=1 Tax=Aspergillus pseudocaelatus TaxID=1825620 RepID=A0ABQ6WDJ3_9EURO|nr:hypothetical protein BDV36DRAFT_298277 [Aspergillus pseudocaelatus]
MSPPKNEPNFAMNQAVQDYYTHSCTLFRQSLLSLMHNAAMRDILPSRPVDYLVTTLGERVSFRIRKGPFTPDLYGRASEREYVVCSRNALTLFAVGLQAAFKAADVLHVQALCSTGNRTIMKAASLSGLESTTVTHLGRQAFPWLLDTAREVVLGIIFMLVLFRAIDPELNGNWLALFQRDQGTCTRIVCSKTNRMSAIANWAVEAEEDLTMIVDVLRSVAAQNVPLEGYF